MNTDIITKGQMKMKTIFPSVEFISPLSEVEVRMALKELCGSKWDNRPFDGEVDKNSFRFIKNNLSNISRAPRPIFAGDFVEQNGKTKVTISLQTRVMSIIGLCLWILGAIALGGYGFVSMLDEGFILAIVSAVIIVGFGVGLLALHYFLIWSSFQRSVAKIKKALGGASQ